MSEDGWPLYIPVKKQIEALFEQDGLEYFEENFEPNMKFPKHRHPFDEIRMIVKGELLYNVSGNKILLRAGDKIIIPSNTIHSKTVQNNKPCLSICSYQVY